MPLRKIIHVDMDAFYASVEQRDNPELRGRPVAVGHGAKRGVVAAASYEARAFGVRSAMPSTTAMRQCAELVFVPPRFEVYRAVSRQIHAIFAHYTALIEPLSLDEAYLDVTQDLRGLQTASATAKEIRARILEETGLTASAGISYNKFLAKLASSQRKPNGQFVITPGNGTGLHRVAADCQVSWRRTCHRGKDAATRHSDGRGSESEVACLSAAAFRQIGRLVSRHRERRRRSAGRCRPPAKILRLGNHLRARPDRADEIEAGIKAMADDVWAWCEKTRAFGRTVTVKVKFADFRQVTRSRSFPVRIARHDLLRQASIELVRTLLPTAKGVRLLGVTVSNFDQAPIGAADELPLFDAGEAIIRDPTRPRASRRQVCADGAPCRQCRPAASRWPGAEMAGRSHDQARRGDHRGDRPGVWPRRVAAPVGASLLVPVVRRGDGDGLAFLRYHHERHRRAEARSDTFVRRASGPSRQRAALLHLGVLQPFLDCIMRAYMRPELATDPRCATICNRAAHSAELVPEVRAALAVRNALE